MRARRLAPSPRSALAGASPAHTPAPAGPLLHEAPARLRSLREERGLTHLGSGALQFTGHERDRANLANGAVNLPDYMHARFYDPGVGRFLSVDPSPKLRLQQPQSWNRYAYTLNNPLKYVDPDGRDAVVFIVSAGPKWDQKGGHSAVWVGSGNR